MYISDEIVNNSKIDNHWPKYLEVMIIFETAFADIEMSRLYKMCLFTLFVFHFLLRYMASLKFYINRFPNLFKMVCLGVVSRHLQSYFCIFALFSSVMIFLQLYSAK